MCSGQVQIQNARKAILNLPQCWTPTPCSPNPYWAHCMPENSVSLGYRVLCKQRSLWLWYLLWQQIQHPTQYLCCFNVFHVSKTLYHGYLLYLKSLLQPFMKAKLSLPCHKKKKTSLEVRLSLMFVLFCVRLPSKQNSVGDIQWNLQFIKSDTEEL